MVLSYFQSTTGSVTVCGSSVNLIGTSPTSSGVTVSGSLQLIGATLPVNSATLTLDFTTLASSVIRFIAGGTPPASNAALTVTGCSDSTWGISFTVVNEWSSTFSITVSAASCFDNAPVTLSQHQAVTFHCLSFTGGPTPVPHCVPMATTAAAGSSLLSGALVCCHLVCW